MNIPFYRNTVLALGITLALGREGLWAGENGDSNHSSPTKEGVIVNDFGTLRDQVLELGKRIEPPAMTPAEGFESKPELKAIFYDALSWKGKPTKVFAWLGMPSKREGKVPGIVLVHGGGGTAFKEWVQKWNEAGYAAISIAVEGQTDLKEATEGSARGGWKSHEWAGPKRNGIYGDSAETLKDQWIYHAVADTILANSLLRSLPEVDTEKVGIMGISWGGVITSTVIGIDQRFAFAIPTYGCGHLFDSENQYGKALGNNELYKKVWDPMVRMNQVKIPVLWLSWPEDEHFPLDCRQTCVSAAPGVHMKSLIPGMKHGHGAAWIPPDSYAFAESIVREGKPWCIQSELKNEGSSIVVKFNSSKTLDRALLISTVDKGFTGKRKWNETPLTLEKEGEQWKVSGSLPAGTTAWFVNVLSGKLTASSDFQEQK